MKEILGCKHCFTVYTGDREVNKECIDCNGQLIPLNIPSEKWKKFSEAERNRIKSDFAHDMESNNYLELEIIGGEYNGCPAVVDKSKEVIRITLNSELALSNRNLSNPYKIIKLSEISKITEGIKLTDNAKQIGLTVGGIAWFGVALYNFSMSGNFLDVILGSISGGIWGGIAWIIAKQFTKKNEVIRILTRNDILIEIINEIQVNHFFMNLPKSSSLASGFQNNDEYNELNKSVLLINKYDQLIKLKDLLDKGILNQDEFDSEKSKILEKTN